jgi:hypothetical protein
MFVHLPNLKTTVQVSVFYNANSKELDLDKVAATAPQRTPSPLQSPPDSLSLHSASLSKNRSRERDQASRKVPRECYEADATSPCRSSSSPPSPSFISLASDSNRTSHMRPNHDVVGSLDREGSCRSFPSFPAVLGESSFGILPVQNYVQSLAAPQHEPYFPSHQILYNHQRPPLIIIPESELPLTASSSGSSANQGEPFYINDYQHSRVPHQTQSSSMTVIPGLVDIDVPDFDPQYHQPVIRVQQQDSQQEPPTSTYMTGRVLLSTKAYSGRS